MKFLTHPAVLDAVEALIGPDITLWSSHFISKPGGDGLPVSWHTDADYWKGRLQPIEVVTVWLAVDRSNRENGCMRVIPGTHHERKERRYRDLPEGSNVFGTTLEENEIDEAKVVDIELEAGECSFHDAWLIHGSLPNHSPRRRCGYTMRYMPSSVVFAPLGPRDTHKVWCGERTFQGAKLSTQKFQNRSENEPETSINTLITLHLSQIMPVFAKGLY
ncbi:MAG: phytanoyl-CoA dioxygenase family protein [Candidatus Omnitrophica bacterium]|nr:phytanoyl-CoA dioxygenase family protein [Candidatus Omnitrophota bacterium]